MPPLSNKTLYMQQKEMNTICLICISLLKEFLETQLKCIKRKHVIYSSFKLNLINLVKQKLLQSLPKVQGFLHLQLSLSYLLQLEIISL